jgi:raffinose/stachyose/melibiose transport system substrate-binding protein
MDLVSLAPFQPTMLGDDFNAQSRHMGDGKAAMQLMGQWALGVQAGNADLGDKLNGVMRFAPFPAVRGGKGGLMDAMGGANGFVIGKNAPDRAIEFLGYLSQKENLQRYSDAFPFIPTVPGVTISNRALVPVSDYLQKASSFTFYPDQTYPSAVNEAMNKLTSRMIMGELSPEQTCAALQAVWESSRGN